jgi:hypothetical protein
VESSAYPALVIDGLSYSDWEDDADRLRRLATGRGRITPKQLARLEQLLASLGDELDAVESVLPGLRGFDAVRVGCVRDLIVALRDGLLETRRMLEMRMAKRANRSKKPTVTA